jgi:hypothetical protein
MSKNKTITGVDGAVVLLKPVVPSQPPGEVFLRRGDELPDNVLDGEVDRLTRLGVFADPATPQPLTSAAAGGRITALEAELTALRDRAETAERTAKEVKAELDAVKKAAPKGAKEAPAPNPAQPVATLPPAPR